MALNKALTLGLQLTKWVSGIFCILVGLGLAMRFGFWFFCLLSLMLGLCLLPYTHRKIQKLVTFNLSYKVIFAIFCIYFVAMFIPPSSVGIRNSTAQKTSEPVAAAIPTQSNNFDSSNISKEDVAKARAVKIVTMQLKDPSSGTFGDRFVMHGSWVCGTVNAKNSFGGYTGMMPFIVNVDSGWTQVLDQSGVYLFKDYYLPLCQGRKPKSLSVR